MERRGARNVNQFRLAPEVCKDGPFKGYSRLDWIHSAASRRPTQRSGSVMHHFTAGNLQRAFQELSGSKAAGIDRVTKQQYGIVLEENLRQLEERIRKGGWRPRPSREVLIPKPQGGTRPLAVGCLEDKIVQLLTARILEALYEPTFHRHSFGFRRGKSAHQAVTRLYEDINKRHDHAVVVEIDIEKFFNSINHERLVEVIAQKVSDTFFLRHIRRLLRASVLHTDGTLAETITGTPQGSPVSPILANICLNHVLDQWFQRDYGGRGELVRYADDAVFVFTDETVAREFLAALKARLNEFGLALNEDKCTVVPFSSAKPKGTFSFLGFEFYWGRRKPKQKCLKVKTAPKRLHRCMTVFEDWIKKSRNRMKLDRLWELAATKLIGHYRYFGVSFNQSKLEHYYWQATQALFKWLNRRSQRRSFTWHRFIKRLQYQPLPRPPIGQELTDITCNSGSEWNRKPKSRMRENRKSGSVRSASLKLVFT
jgi:RNA-directed DNA polymerase